jgi:hypothetical protein
MLVATLQLLDGLEFLQHKRCWVSGLVKCQRSTQLLHIAHGRCLALPLQMIRARNHPLLTQIHVTPTPHAHTRTHAHTHAPTHAHAHAPTSVHTHARTHTRTSTHAERGCDGVPRIPARHYVARGTSERPLSCHSAKDVSAADRVTSSSAYATQTASQLVLAWRRQHYAITFAKHKSETRDAVATRNDNTQRAHHHNEHPTADNRTRANVAVGDADAVVLTLPC